MEIEFKFSLKTWNFLMCLNKTSVHTEQNVWCNMGSV
jgi:hypothetical protein